MYGRVSSNQNPSWGNSYSDTLTITLKQGGGTVTSSSASVTSSVSPTCTVSAGSLGFGVYAPAAASTSTASVAVNCSSGAAYQVSLSGGNNASGSTRRMAGPSASYLSYQLFSDSGRTTLWGDGTALGAKLSRTGTGSAQTLTVYGRIPAGQSVRAGSYNDVVVVNVEY
jgi:spore coat protein U-like protein